MDEDPNRILLQVALILLLVLLNAFFAAAEMALVSVRRTRIRQLVEEGDIRAEIVQKLLDRPTNFMATVQIGVTLVGFLASALTAVNIAGIPARWLQVFGLAPETARGTAVFLMTCVIGFVTLVLGEIAPKSLAMLHAEKLALLLSRPIYWLSVLALPAVKTVSFVSDLVVRPFGAHVRFSAPILTEEELKMLVEAGEEEGVIEEEEKEMIHSIFDFTDTVVRQVMKPRTDMKAAPITSSLDDLLDLITTTGHTRIPIYDENVDHIVGIVHAKDLLPILRQDKRLFDIKAVMREAYFIPETKDVDELLAEFKRGNIQMAIVRDEYGGTAGLVTLEDLIEEIVGEIRDEYDVEEPLIQIIDEDHAIVNARMSVDDLNEQMKFDIPESEDYETIGGFVFDLFGRQPNEGETISYSNLDFKVEKVEDGRLRTISVTRTDRPIEPSEHEFNGGNGKSKANSHNGLASKRKGE
ncbi:MAG: hemolysin family protein [Armatimonadetes bacterium]|nr:hemolysin family protein [Armatimonadota bacterium]